MLILGLKGITTSKTKTSKDNTFCNAFLHEK